MTPLLFDPGDAWEYGSNLNLEKAVYDNSS